jgi:hypothetical protein
MKPMLLRRLLYNTGSKKVYTIGILGINRGVGVTYTGMLLSYYFSTEKRLKTAFIECNNNMDFELLQEEYEWSKEDDQSFSLDRITYYKQVSATSISDILNEDFQCYIFDFGTNYTSFKEEFIRCGSKIILGDRGLWNQRKMVTFLKSIKDIKGSKGWIHMIPFADRREVMKLANITERHFFRIPFESDPASLSKETYKMFYNLFG